MAEFLKRFNWLMFAAMVALVGVGATAIRSAGCTRAETVFHTAWQSHLLTAAFALAAYFLAAYVDYRKVLDFVAWPAYAASVAFLVLVLLVGDDRFGGRRWLWFFQPSEVAKLGVILALSSLCGRLRGFRGLLVAFAVVGVPLGLILLEPDLGTALVLVPAAFAMLLASGLCRRWLLAALAALAVAAFAVLGAVYEAERPGTPPERRERILSYLPLKDHQVRRVRVFLFPEREAAGAGYNLRQSKITIGSGGLSGRGIGRGEAHRLKYLPQVISMNDFIFCVWAEETGYLGSLALIALFAALLLSACWTVFRAADRRGAVLALGFATLVFAHVYVNVAMAVGMVPITGLPLPFISAGRTFLVTVTVGFGLIQSVSIYGREKT